MMEVFHERLQRMVRLEPARRPTNPHDKPPVIAPLGGKQAKIYECAQDKGVLFKIFEEDMRFPDMKRKLQVLQAACSGIPGVCPIVDLVYESAGGECLGYTMPELKGQKLLHHKYRSDSERVRIAMHLAKIAFALQVEGVGPSDLHNENILIVKGRPVLIDVDSFFFLKRTFQGVELEHHLGLGTPDFSPPEMWGQKDPQHNHNTAAYSLAVNLHMILKDRHPAELKNRSGAIINAWDSMGQHGYGRFINPHKLIPLDEGIPWADLPSDIKRHFNDTFDDGLVIPSVRPTAERWAASLEDWHRSLMFDMRRLWPLVGGASAAVLLIALVVWGVSGSSGEIVAAVETPPPPPPSQRLRKVDLKTRNFLAENKLQEAKRQFQKEMDRRAEQWRQAKNR